MDNRGFSPYQQGGPTSWEGMYDEVPQPNIPSGPQGMTRAGSMGRGMHSNIITFHSTNDILTEHRNYSSAPGYSPSKRPDGS